MKQSTSSLLFSENTHYFTDLNSKGPQGRIGNFGGPDIMTLREMAELETKLNNSEKVDGLFHLLPRSEIFHFTFGILC